MNYNYEPIYKPIYAPLRQKTKVYGYMFGRRDLPLHKCKNCLSDSPETPKKQEASLQSLPWGQLIKLGIALSIGHVIVDIAYKYLSGKAIQKKI